MARRVCLAIGVSTVTPLQDEALSFPYLDGAFVAARKLGTWALRLGFGEGNIRVIDDGQTVEGRSYPVTRARVQQAVDELFPPGAEAVQQLVLMFCGHGLTDENFNSISWLFSDSLQQRYRIVADRFYAELQLYGVERITLISDACREPPKNFDLLRLEPTRGITSPTKARVASPRTDRFAACQDGKQGYMVSDPMSAAQGKCVFSGVITDALWGLEPSAFQDNAVTTSSLGICVIARAKERAEQYFLTLDPDCSVYPLPASFFNRSKPPEGPPDVQAWPPALKPTPAVSPMLTEHFSGEAQSGFNLKDFTSLNFKIHTLPDTEEVGWLSNHSGPSNDVDPVVLRKRARVTPKAARHALEVGQSLRTVVLPPRANLVVVDRKSEVWSQTPGKCLLADPRTSAFAIQPTHVGAPSLLRLSNGSFTQTVIYQQLCLIVTTSSTGGVYQAYGHRNAAASRFHGGAIQVIEAFAAGHINAVDVDRIAAWMRWSKHEDPMLGVLSAHLYRVTADLDSIRRMAYFYACQGQPVPFDIALLGEMPVTRSGNGVLLAHVPRVAERVSPISPGVPEFVTHETAAVTVPVGGRCPWIGLGWDYVAEPRTEWSALVEGLEEFSPYIPRSGCTVFNERIASRLVELWGLNQMMRSP